jgi:tRNA threonylcarbamoyladenosine biosynthesis protein TsaB
MYILTIRTDNPQAEIGLYNDAAQIAYVAWQAHRQLAETIHLKIKEILDQAQLTERDIAGIVVFKGPGSFTGLRIGFAVANALAASLNVAIVSAMDESWKQTGIDRLLAQENEKVALPEYGALPNITKPRK